MTAVTWVWGIPVAGVVALTGVARAERAASQAPPPAAHGVFIPPSPPRPVVPPRYGPRPSHAARAPAPEEIASIQRHDGFYLRLGLGAGRITTEFRRTDVSTLEGRGTGASSSFEIALGGTVGSGLVLGGAMVADAAETVISDDVTLDGRPVLREGWVLQYEAVATLIGPFVDWYLDDTLGFHVQAAVGLASIDFREGDVVSSRSSSGYGLLGGVGYELWVGDQWSMGVLARATMYSTKDDESVTVWEHVAFVLPGLLLTVTHH